MRTHIELLAEEGLRQGLGREEATRRAHLAFGNVLATREESEEAMGWPQLESWWQDLRLTVRALSRRPMFAVSLVLILALGIGVTAAIFTLLRGVMWTALPVPRPEEIQLVARAGGKPFLLSRPTLRRLEETPEMRGRAAGYTSSGRLVLRRDAAAAEPLEAQFVTGGFFDALQVAPALGRLINAADDLPGKPAAVVVLTWDWWQKNLGGDPKALGTDLRLNGQRVTIVGVTPKDFAGVSVGDDIAAWLPVGLHAALRASPSAWIISADEGPALEQWMTEDSVAVMNLLLRADAALAPRLAGFVESAWRPQRDSALAVMTDPRAREEFSRDIPRPVPSPQGFSSTREDFRKTGLTLSLLVTAVVLVTLANTSTLLLLRMLARGREIGVRLALGAGRWRLARAALMEGLVLSLAGSAAGLVLAWWLTPLLADWLLPSSRPTPAMVDTGFLLALGGLAVVSGLLLGALPAWLSAHLSPQAILRRGSAGQRGSLAFGRGLIVVQLALSVLLVSVAASLALDLRKALAGNLGYARENVVSAFFNFAAAGIPAEQQPAVMERLRQAALAMPRVQAVGFSASGVLSGNRSASGLYFRGEAVNRPGNTVHESVDENYIAAMGMTLVRGRGITADDAKGRPQVALISQRLARQVFGDTDPLGRRFGFDETASDPDWEIVGIVADIRVNGARSEPVAMLYTPLRQWPNPASCMAIRVEGEAIAARESLRKAVTGVEPALMFGRWMTVEERVQRWVRNDVAAVRLTAGFGALALLLAGIGVVGALGYLVASRSREIAVRLAIGADPGRVWRDIVREALGLGIAGAAIGLVLAVALPRWLGSWMMTGLLANWAAIAGAVAAGILAAFIGGLVPARRAARVDPLTLLKSE